MITKVEPVKIAVGPDVSPSRIANAIKEQMDLMAITPNNRRWRRSWLGAAWAWLRGVP